MKKPVTPFRWGARFLLLGVLLGILTNIIIIGYVAAQKLEFSPTRSGFSRAGQFVGHREAHHAVPFFGNSWQPLVVEEFLIRSEVQESWHKDYRVFTGSGSKVHQVGWQVRSFGWPYRVAYYRTGSGAIVRAIFDENPKTKKRQAPSGIDGAFRSNDTLFPRKIIWPGFLGNTVVLGSPLIVPGLALLVFSYIRRAMRAKGFRCTTCGYSRERLRTQRCPECGNIFS